MNPVLPRVIPATALLCALTACTVPPSPMPYTPTVSISPDPARRQSIKVGQVTDERKESDPTWFGAIRGGYGNPLKVLRADTPVAQVVERAFADGLRGRGLYADAPTGSKYTLSILVHQFEASQMVRRDANVDLSVTLTDEGTGRTVWRDRHAVRRVDGYLIAVDTGILASPADLRAVALRAMSEAVDVLLDRPGFRTALR